MRSFKGKKIIFVILPVLLFALMGCVASEENRKKDSEQLPKGLLDDYTGMERSLMTKQVYFYVNPDIDPEKYKSVIVDPVLIFVHASVYGEGMNPSALNKISNIYRKNVAKSIGGIYALSKTPGQGTLRLRTAFLNIVPALDSGKDALHPLAGVSMEAEFVDSVTGERVGSVLHYRLGKGTDDFSSATPDERTRKILKKWAGLIRAAADKITIK